MLNLLKKFMYMKQKKVLIAASLMTSAHLYIWDEPLNYIDVFSRMQIEKLIEEIKNLPLWYPSDISETGSINSTYELLDLINFNKAFYISVLVNVEFCFVFADSLDYWLEHVGIVV